MTTAQLQNGSLRISATQRPDHPSLRLSDSDCMYFLDRHTRGDLPGSQENTVWAGAGASGRLWQCRCFFVLTCEYCMSHYITALARLPDCRVLARLNLKGQRLEIEKETRELAGKTQD